MLYTENVTINGMEFVHTWSDTYTIMRDGNEYDDAYDPINTKRVYTETQNIKPTE